MLLPSDSFDISTTTAPVRSSKEKRIRDIVTLNEETDSTVIAADITVNALNALVVTRVPASGENKDVIGMIVKMRIRAVIQNTLSSIDVATASMMSSHHVLVPSLAMIVMLQLTVSSNARRIARSFLHKVMLGTSLSSLILVLLLLGIKHRQQIVEEIICYRHGSGQLRQRLISRFRIYLSEHPQSSAIISLGFCALMWNIIKPLRKK